jgi:hypothetical protein
LQEFQKNSATFGLLIALNEKCFQAVVTVMIANCLPIPEAREQTSKLPSGCFPVFFNEFGERVKENRHKKNRLKTKNEMKRKKIKEVQWYLMLPLHNGYGRIKL